MRQVCLLLFMVFPLLYSCTKETNVSAAQPPPLNNVLLKDIVIATLPSLYYHFEYDNSGKYTFVSFASDFNRYNIVYSDKRISEMRNNILVNKDRLYYVYDNTGRVSVVRYLDSTGIVYTQVELAYDGQKLIKLTRERRSGTGFVADKTMIFSYHTDGNLFEIAYHYLPFKEQTDVTFTDKFENYDNKINVDGFSLIHNDFFDHLVFLPNVPLQVNNPLKETRTGDGINYMVNYTYTYNEKNLPLAKKGVLTITSDGSDKGNVISISSAFSYY